MAGTLSAPWATRWAVREPLQKLLRACGCVEVQGSYRVAHQIAADGKKKPTGGCAPIYHAWWHAAIKLPGALRGGRPERVFVSRFEKKRIQMNFAENKSWPSSVERRGRPTRVLAGSMRAGKPVEPFRPGHAPSAPIVPYLIDNHFALPPTGWKKFSSVRGTVVHVDFHETGRSGFTTYWKDTEAPWA